MANAHRVSEPPAGRAGFLFAAAALVVVAAGAVFVATQADADRIEASAFEEPDVVSEAPAPANDGAAAASGDDEDSQDGDAEVAAAPVEAAPLPLKTYNLNTPLSDAPFEPLETTEWFNSEPITKADLEGRVVLYDFWTHGCINCKNTLPSLKAWYERYEADGLQVIGVHSAEFNYEKDPVNVEQALVDLGVTWPVVNDPEKKVWRQFNTRFWPTFAIYDELDTLRYAKKGEGRYAEIEDYIRDVLDVDPDSPRSNDPEQV